MEKMEIVFDYDDKTGTWSEAPEAYGGIECATKEDYEYAKKAIKGYKELEAKHWDECRQIAHYDDELKDLREENKVLIRECDRLIKEKGELLSKVSGGDVLRICQLEEQLEKAKRLLKAAVEDMNDNEICYDINACNVCTQADKVSCDTFKWRYTDEALKLIGGETDEQI